jgi:ubiquinone/menaquinone biosynthesis C-methylase UbiE
MRGDYYLRWHEAYEDPDSSMSWRLRTVQGHLTAALDTHEGDVRILSLCSGDGRDVIGVLAGRPDVARIRATLVDNHPVIVERARARAAKAGLEGIEVRMGDAGTTSTFLDVVPADVVLLVGVFGNITDADIERTVRASPRLCRPGATVLWTRGRSLDAPDISTSIRKWFAESGFVDLAYDELVTEDVKAVGVARYEGAEQPMECAERLFEFIA